MKKITYILIAFLLIFVAIATGGIIKYNLELNKYIKQATIETLKSENESIDKKTEVHLLGTVHFETQEIKRDDIYNVIDGISPSIILYESDANTVSKILERRIHFAQFIQAFKSRTEIEKAIALRYIEHNPNCVILPYEWELRDQFHRKHNLSSKAQEMIMAVIELDNKNVLTHDQSIIINKYLALSRELNTIGQQTISDINSVATDSLVEERQYYQYVNITEIVNDRKELSGYVDFAQINRDYWDIRNKAMAQNILTHIKQNPNKVIVVLNGFYHRYYLRNELKKYEVEYNFSLN